MSSRTPRATPRPAPPTSTPASSTSARLRGEWLLIALALVLVLVALYPGPLLQGRIFASGDARNADAFTLVGDAARSRGEYPLWNPYLFAGMPTFGSLGYVRGVYPPSILLNFVQERLGFPPLTWLFVHLLFGGLGVAFLLARWGVAAPARALGAVAWVLSPNVVAWSVHGHGSKLGAAMFMPWIVAGALDVLAGGGRRSVALTGLLLGLQIVRGHVQITYYTLLAVGLLAVIQTAWPFLPTASGRRLGEPASSFSTAGAGTRWRRLAAVAGALALGFLLGAVLLLPVHSYAGLSIRGLAESGGGASYGYATAWSLSPSELSTLVLPAASGFGRGTYCGPMPFTDYPNYFGFLLLALAVAAAWSGRGRFTTALAGLSLLALLVSFGKHDSPLYDLLYRYLPFFNKFRVPVMILVLPALALAVLAALGADALTRTPAESSARARRARALFPLALAALGGLLLLLGVTGLGEAPYVGHLRALAASAHKQAPPPLQLAAAWALQRADLLRVGLLLLAAAGAVVWAGRREGYRRVGLIWTLVALVALDLGGVAGRITHPERSLVDVGRDASGRAALVPATPLLRRFTPPRADLGQGAIFVELASRARHDRVWPLGPLAGNNDFMVAGVRSLGGYHPAKLSAYEQVRRRLFEGEEPAARIASWLSARVLALPGELPAEAQPYLRQLGADLLFPPFARGDEMVLYENRSALPRARLLAEWTPAAALPGGADVGAFLDALQRGEIPFARSVVLDASPEPAPAPTAEPLPPVEFVTDGLNDVVLRTAAPTPAVLLLADMAAPGWSVTIDGRAARALRGDLVLRAVAVPAGEHTVRWRYREPALARGLALTGLGGVGLLALLVPWPPRRRRPRRADGDAADARRDEGSPAREGEPL